ncbi:MAG: hypothetical protein ACYS8X_12335 [Planctomycetota bacterium]
MIDPTVHGTTCCTGAPAPCDGRHVPWAPPRPGESARSRPAGRLAKPLPRDVRLARRISAGERTTWEYAVFCRRRGITELGAVFRPRRPEPFAYRRPVQCRSCGELFETIALADDPAAGVCLLEERWTTPYDSTPSEWTCICPACTAIESFQSPVVCATCGDRPCTCRENDR